MESHKLVITERVREQFVNACDSVHPKEAGGYLFGSVIGDVIRVEDILPLKNRSERPQTSFAFAQEDLELADLYAKTKGMKRLGIFHSHPDGSIPSLADIRGVQELEVWILHKKNGLYRQAELVYTKMLETLKKYEKQDKKRIHKGLALQNLGIALFSQGKIENAKKRITEAYEEDKLTYGEEVAEKCPAKTALTQLFPPDT